MSDTLRHRGPDGEGIWTDPTGRVGFAHRRLAIIDLSESALQPMVDVSGDLTIVLNGEIYNHAELRRELSQLGKTRWQTDHSDTEVILQAFHVWGIDCIHRLRGMFAFAIWDRRSRELWLVRDRIGIKPLYYSRHNGSLRFASEIKALLSLSDQPKEVDEQALYHYLTFLSAPAPMTLFRGIQKLPAGSWMRLGDGGSTKILRYWDVLDETTPLTDRSEEEIAEMLRAEFEEAVKLRKVSDVPVGVFLSGGIDSSANCVLFSEGEQTPVQTFYIGYRGELQSHRNEDGYARQVAEKVGARHHELFLDCDDLLSFVRKMVHHQDEPLADPVCVPLYFVSKLAREQGVIVCQVGEGSDELFIGYPAWKKQYRLQELVDSPWLRWTRPMAGGLLQLWPRKLGSRYEFLRRGFSGEPVFWSGAGAFTEHEKKGLLTPSLRQRLNGLSSYDIIAGIRSRFLEKAWEGNSLNWMSYMDLNHRLPELLLMRVDKMSMATSLEARVPFLDHQFVALAMSVPSQVKFRDQNLKHILKLAFRGVVPEEIINRPKQGFGVPLGDWLLQKLGEESRQTVKLFCRESGLVEWDSARHFFNMKDTARIWSLWNLSAWWVSHFHGNGAAESVGNREQLER